MRVFLQHYSKANELCPEKKKCRAKSNSIKEILYDVPDTLCDRIHIKDVKKSSGATINTRISSSPGYKTFVIRGTGSQRKEALRLITDATGQKAEILMQAETYWLQWIDAAFPHLEKRTYFLPPVFIRRVPTSETTVSGLSLNILVTKTQCDESNNLTQPLEASSSTALNQNIGIPSVQDSDISDDEALQRVLYSLQQMSKELKEVFMCLSQFRFGSYLGEPCYAPAAAHLPLPTNLPKEFPWSWRQGDFDVLIIHPLYGFVVFEIKSAGSKNESSNEQERKNIAKKFESVLKQLKKAEAMLSHLVSDTAAGLRITKIFVCPNLSARQIQKAISYDKKLEKEMTEIFKTKDSADVTRMILCSDHLWSPNSSPSEHNEKLKALTKWWKDYVTQPGPDSILANNPDLYKNLVARFCGPASTMTIPRITEPRISLKTWDQAVRYVGDCYTAHITLFPEQIELLNKAPARVFITGPPGTGKTVVLFLIAVEWLRQGANVFLLSTWERSIAATLMMEHLLQDAVKTQLDDVPTTGQVRVLTKNFRLKEDVEATLEELTRAAGDGTLNVIADEVGPDLESQYYIFPDFCAKLLDRFRNRKDRLHLWAECCLHRLEPELPADMEQEEWERKCFTRPLRAPPSVIREVEQAVEIRTDSTVYGYSAREVPDHADGPPVKWLYHRPSLDGLRVEVCTDCGRLLANFLLETLRLDINSASLGTEDLPTDSNNRPLQYKDVLILSWVHLRDDAGVLKALSDAGIPVRVMQNSDIEDVATARTDVVWAARQQLVCGLERKVVIVLSNYDDSKGQYAWTRLHAMSRCSSQLVVVCPPPGQD